MFSQVPHSLFFWFQEMPENESIFFFETNDEIHHLKARTLCSVESAARYNPDRKVFLLLTTKVRTEHPLQYFSIHSLSLRLANSLIFMCA